MSRAKNVSLSWKISEEELKNQVENYDTLKLTQSYKGNAFIAGLVVVGISIAIIFLGLVEDIGSVFFSLIIYAIILFFVYKGHKWAIIAFMIIYTLDQAYNLYSGYESGSGGILPLIWWAIIIPFFWKALKIENERKRIAIENTPKDTEGIFCKKCGASLEIDSKFCIKCGNKTI